ncbi:hypothetical protein DEO72_LG7g921 [Vigna unguiculata]|uniref:Uncharacterized protein n=1 Tax=Vigna unguiculata TaxID=3917 RepID=A0A4D6MF53_VIGUN|nr:hypothetical protein DEO72_LG7g921 [Vigna unguiculata]
MPQPPPSTTATATSDHRCNSSKQQPPCRAHTGKRNHHCRARACVRRDCTRRSNPKPPPAPHQRAPAPTTTSTDGARVLKRASAPALAPHLLPRRNHRARRCRHTKPPPPHLYWPEWPLETLTAPA